jgi:2-keto-4-pentenoate hydratase/2-oxohepta-3-ene-1,7-dioic acid hydratase in catechol pathway
LKLVLFKREESVRFGLLVEGAVVDATDIVPPGQSPMDLMRGVIDGFDDLREPLAERQRTGARTPIGEVRLLPPVPQPRKIINCIANYWEHAQREARPLNMFLKNPDAVVGPEDTIELPDFDEPWAFMHEAELVLVIKGPAKKITQENWREAVFGYTCGIDVTARGEGRVTWKKGSWLGKSFDTFAPIGPCIVTADEIENPNDLHVQFWNNGELRHNYSTDDMEHQVPEIIEFATRIMTLQSGDLIFCGTNHEGLGFIQDGERVEMEIKQIGRMGLNVIDPLKRSWERGVYAGHDSTNHDAVRRNRPDLADLLKS